MFSSNDLCLEQVSEVTNVGKFHLLLLFSLHFNESVCANMSTCQRSICFRRRVLLEAVNRVLNILLSVERFIIIIIIEGAKLLLLLDSGMEN